MKTYFLLIGAEQRKIRSWNTGNARADLDSALVLAEGYLNMGCPVRVECNGELVSEWR